MSRHLKAIIEKNNQLASTQVVFLDIEKYSQRRTTNQVGIINEFTNCLQQTLKDIGQEFIEFMQKNDLNFRTDVILLPTGDGAAISFTFEGLHNIHVKFAEYFLKNEYIHNQSSPICEKFETNGWCNCHNKFNVRIGIDEGKAIIYKDINDNYNIAGNPINMAARLLGEANRNQILLTETAYKQIVDLEENPNYNDEFIEVKDVIIKHDLKINIYVLKSDKEYINSKVAEKHLKNAKIQVLGEKAKEIFKSQIDLDSSSAKDRVGDSIIQMTSILGDIIKTIANESPKDLNEEIKPTFSAPKSQKKTRRSK